MRASKTLVAVHIGAHKTGTSVLQRFLRAHERQLRRQRVTNMRRGELRPFVGWGQRLVADPGALAAHFAQFRRGHWARTLVASNENIVGRPFGAGGLYADAPATIAALGVALDGGPARLLLGLRPQDELLESYYLQTVNEGGYESFADWLRGIDLDALSWRPVVDAARAAVGADNVAVIDFRVFRQGQAEFLRRCLTAIDPRITLPLDWDVRQNRSLSARGLDIALAVNPHLHDGAERNTVRKFLQQHFSNVDSARPQLLGDDQRAQLRARYAAEYDELTAPLG